MFWVVQKDFYAKSRRFDLFDVLERLGIPHAAVDVRAGLIDPDLGFELGQSVMANGSIMMTRIAAERGWSPGGFVGENFSYARWSHAYGDLLLNKNAKPQALKDAAMMGDSMFARPVLDDKSFNGRVFGREEFLRFQQESVEGRKGAARPETMIVTAEPKFIGQEHRHFIVDGAVVASSRYKLAGKANFSEGADPAVVEVARAAARRWSPARAFVMDTYISKDDIGIVEIGSIGHAGIYEADLPKIVWALDSMEPLLAEKLKGKGKKVSP
jgi:hypothetical protein